MQLRRRRGENYAPLYAPCTTGDVWNPTGRPGRRVSGPRGERAAGSTGRQVIEPPGHRAIAGRPPSPSRRGGVAVCVDTESPREAISYLHGLNDGKSMCGSVFHRRYADDSESRSARIPYRGDPNHKESGLRPIRNVRRPDDREWQSRRHPYLRNQGLPRARRRAKRGGRIARTAGSRGRPDREDGRVATPVASPPCVECVRSATVRIK